MREALLAIVLAFSAMTCAAYSQQPVYAIQYQPIVVAGDLYAVPRRLPVMNWAFGPQVIWVPRPQVPYANQAPPRGPVQ